MAHQGQSPMHPGLQRCSSVKYYRVFFLLAPCRPCASTPSIRHRIYVMEYLVVDLLSRYFIFKKPGSRNISGRFRNNKEVQSGKKKHKGVKLKMIKILRRMALLGALGIIILGCSSIVTTSKFHGQQLTETGAETVAHIHSDIWGIYFLGFLSIFVP